MFNDDCCIVYCNVETVTNGLVVLNGGFKGRVLGRLPPLCPPPLTHKARKNKIAKNSKTEEKLKQTICFKS